MILNIFLLIFGFALLIKGADFLVEGSSSVAKKHGISNLVIGLTIVAFGTSAPELVVSAVAALKDNAGIAMGNIIGSNISNTLLILGVSAIIRPLLVKRTTVNKEIPLSLLAILAVFFLANDKLIDGFDFTFLTRSDGLVLILFFSIFIYYIFTISKDNETIIDALAGDGDIKKFKTIQSIGMIVFGLVGLFLGGQFIVNSAVYIATSFGLSSTLIGLTLVAIGTSLPELAASGMAAYRGKTDMAVGNVIGSNIFNLLWVLGVSSVIRPISYSDYLNTDFYILFGITTLLLFFIFLGKRNVVGRNEGTVLIFVYVVYLIFLIFRG